MIPNQIVASPCCNPEMTLPEILAAYSSIGYDKFEMFTTWVKSMADFTKSPDEYIKLGRQFNMSYHSFHLPPIRANQYDKTLDEAIKATRFASKLGANIVLYKAETRELYIKAAHAFLDGIDGIDIIPVVQNHFGTAVSTLEDVKEVHTGINDKRMKSLLEVGHFHSAGVPWKKAAEYLGDSIALIHIKDQIGPQSVPFGKGEINLHGLFQNMDDARYNGCYVVEMEVKDKENTLNYLKDAYQYMIKYCSGDKS